MKRLAKIKKLFNQMYRSARAFNIASDDERLSDYLDRGDLRDLEDTIESLCRLQQVLEFGLRNKEKSCES